MNKDPRCSHIFSGWFIKKVLDKALTVRICKKCGKTEVK